MRIATRPRWPSTTRTTVGASDGMERGPGLRVGVSARAIGRRGRLSLSAAKPAARVRQLPFELADFVGGARDLRRAPLRVAPAGFGFLRAARALHLLQCACRLGPLERALRTLSTPHQLERPAGFDAR